MKLNFRATLEICATLEKFWGYRSENGRRKIVHKKGPIDFLDFAY